MSEGIAHISSIFMNYKLDGSEVMPSGTLTYLFRDTAKNLIVHDLTSLTRRINFGKDLGIAPEIMANWVNAKARMEAELGKEPSDRPRLVAA